MTKKYQKQKKAAAGHARKKIAWRAPESLAIRWSPVNQAYFALWPGKGRIQDQQVLKVASAEAMHDWLRETYGNAYGIAGRTPSASHAHSRRKTDLDLHRDLHEPGALRSATDRQLRGFYRDEKHDVAKARAEGERRGLTLHARKKSPSQLDREIAEVVPAWRGDRSTTVHATKLSLSEEAVARMIGRRVKSAWHGLNDGEIIQWDPFGAGGTDVLVKDVVSGHLSWYASHGLTPIDGKGPLPSRSGVRAMRAAEMEDSMKKIGDRWAKEPRPPRIRR